MADPAIWQALLETGNPYVQQERQQKGLMGMMLLEEKQREMEGMQKLRDIYSSGQPVSPEKVMGFNPKLGIELQQAQTDQYIKGLQAQETKGKIDLQAADQAAAAAFPAYITYQENIQRGMPENEALAKFHSMNGDAVSKAAQAGESWVQAGTSYDPDKVSPDTVRAINARFGRISPFDKFQQESQLEAMKTGYGIKQKQALGASDRYFIGPDGLPHPNPIFQQGGGMPSAGGGGQGAYSEPAPYQFTAPSGQKIMAYDLGSAAQALQQLPEGADREAASKWIDEQWSGLRNPEKVKTKTEVAAETAGAAKKAELKAEKEATLEQRADILSSIPDRSTIEGLIDKSIGSGLEQQVKGRIGPMVGQSSEALEATKQLDVIAPQLKSITKSLAGAGAISDFEQKMMADAAGAIADPNVPPEARKAAFRTFMDVMDKANKGPGKAAPKSGLPRPATAAEARALPPGTRFLDPDGNERINE